MRDFSWLYEKVPQEESFICLLCPHHCRLLPGQNGICRSRQASDKGIFPVHPAPVTAIALDPIEKKPFFHYLPGSFILSIGFSGCNLKCPFCQNWHLAHIQDQEYYDLKPEGLPALCRQKNSPGTAFTYSEPLIHFEYLINSAEALHRENLSALLVSNGYINKKPGRVLADKMDAVKVDLKGFSNEWYEKELGGGLKAVLDFIEICADTTHLEVVTLVIPGKNDSPEEIRQSARFLSSLNPDIPFHLTAYYPQYHYSIPPTSAESILKLAETAREHLNYVYTGNIGVDNSTICPRCGKVLIRRSERQVSLEAVKEGFCSGCGYKLYGRC